MHTRHLSELVGQDEPVSGLTVHGYNKPFDFEYQVGKHLEMAMRQWPNLNKKKEDEIRLCLAIGCAWLHYDPRYDAVGFDTESMHKTGAGNQGWAQASLFDSEEQGMASAPETEDA